MPELDLDTLSEQCAARTQLFGIMFVLLSRCNHNCVHCYIPGHTSDGLPADTICRAIDEARALGALNVTFTGGEILLRKDLPELIRHARSRYMRVFLMSNAYALDETYVQELAQLHISEYSTTVYSMDEAVHDRITRVPGSLCRTLRNIELLKQYDIDVTVKTPLMAYNAFAYREVEAFADKNHFNFRTTPTIFSRTDGAREPHNHEIRSGLRRIVEETDRINGKYRGELIARNDGGIPCRAGHSSICVNYDGAVWPCNTLTLEVGNIQSQTLTEIWKRSAQLNEWRTRCRSVPTVCKTCELHARCIRCPGLAYMEDGDLYGCSSSARRIAAERI